MPRRSRFNISNTNETINLRERRLAEGKLFDYNHIETAVPADGERYIRIVVEKPCQCLFTADSDREIEFEVYADGDYTGGDLIDSNRLNQFVDGNDKGIDIYAQPTVNTEGSSLFGPTRSGSTTNSSASIGVPGKSNSRDGRIFEPGEYILKTTNKSSGEGYILFSGEWMTDPRHNTEI